MANYLEDVDLYYEIVISKGKGCLTRKAEHYFELIAKNVIRRKSKDYNNNDDLMDCMQTGLLAMFENWMSFDEKKYKLALPYLSEVFKRGLASGLNEIYNKKPHQTSYIKYISLDTSNDNKGLHNI